MSPSPEDVVIVSALRTPMCRSRKGGLARVPPGTLVETVFSATLEQTRVNGAEVEDICMGNCLMPPSGYAAVRMGHISAGIPAETTGLQMINRQCSSGLQAVANIAGQIATKQINVGIGGGVESMSFYPMNAIKLPDVDWDKMQKNQSAMECLTPMGITSENVASKYGLQRAKLDAFAAESHAKAAKAQAEGKFQREIVPVGNVTQDDGIRVGTTVEGLGKLKPAFQAGGSTTAGNSSQTTDGAAAVLLMTRAEANRRGLPVIGVWKGYSVKAVPPAVMGIGPAVAIPAVLKQTGLNLGDIDVFEINEAFASQATWCCDELGIDMKKVNPNGGAISLGHPLGCTGARQIATLLSEMHRERKRYGVISMCIGTGMGAAAVIEVEPGSRM